ncbi:MAG: hypothetical protein ABFS09_07635 [Thermodesulfobacteriota bacterium]
MKNIPLAIAPLFFLLILMSFNQDAQAETGDIALGAKISTLGVGPDITIGLLDSLNIRAAGHWGEIDVDGDGEEVDYDLDLDLRSGLVTAEWYPFSGRDFHIVAGAFINGNSFDGKADITLGFSYNIGGSTYTFSEIGSLDTEIDYNSVGPYFGFGWGNPVHKDSNLSYFMDFGIAYQGSPDVSLRATGTEATDPVFLSSLKEEEDELQDDLDDFKYYPVISLGLTYKFF